MRCIAAVRLRQRLAAMQDPACRVNTFATAVFLATLVYDAIAVAEAALSRRQAHVKMWKTTLLAAR